MKKKRIIVEISVVVVLLILSLTLIFKEPISNLDEIWEYNFARNILDGKIIYNEFSIIVTPFYPFLASIFLKLLGNELIVMRIFNSLLFFSILYSTYLLLKKLKININIIFLIVYFIYYMFINVIGVEYNYLVLLLVLIALYVEIILIENNKENEKYYNLVLGLLWGLVILTKQTIGCIMAFTFISCTFIKCNRCTLKESIIICLYKTAGIIIPILVFAIYLICNNATYNFISYCFLGIKEFTNKISYFELFSCAKISIRIFSIFIPIAVVGLPIIYLKMKKKYIIKKYYLLMYIYSTIMLIGMFPGPNAGHFIIYAYLFIVYLFILLYKLYERKINELIDSKHNMQFKLLIYLLFGITIIIMTSQTIRVYKENPITYLEHYKFNPIRRGLEDSIYSVDNYVLNNNKKVVILDSSAAVYMIPINRYNKDYDMLNKGNFGYKGEERLIDEISKKENIQYLILKDKYHKNWQMPLNIIEYVKNNKTKVGEIGGFYIYE